MSRLWYKKPASIWEEALPIGNGRLGAMIFGGIDNEHIQVNEETMWFGGAVNRNNPDMRDNLELIREHLERGRISKAERLMDNAMSGCPESMHPYQTLGDISISFDRPKECGKNEVCQDGTGVSDYTRSLDLDTALCETVFTYAGTTYRREYFASHPADCIVIRYSAKGEGRIGFTARMRRGRWFDGIRKVGSNGICLYGNLGRGGCEFAMELRAFSQGGRVYNIGECLKVEDAKSVLLIFTADTTNQYSGSEKDVWVEEYLQKNVPLVEGLTEELSEYEEREYRYQAALQEFLNIKINERFERIAKDVNELSGNEHTKMDERREQYVNELYEQLYKEHIEDYCGIYGRFEFELEGADRYDTKPTDERLNDVKNAYAKDRDRTGRGAEAADIGLNKILFDFGRYLTIAASREGGLPTTLQGLWNKDFFPSWDSKYTININTEMNYWHVESCNLSDCHMPLFELIEKVRRNGRYTARYMYGCRGFVAHHNTDMHGDAAPQDIWYPGSYWTMGGAWLCTHMWMHYRYTKDMEFLKKAFPVMAEAALFFVDFLIEKDGYLVTSPSVSPENSYILPNGEKGACCIGATMDNQILRDLFGGCIGAWNALGNKAPEGCEIEDVENIAELMEQIAGCMARLRPDRISGSGRIMEWSEDYGEVEPGHRHISHLYGLYPAEQITVDGTPELAEAAKKTLEHRLANGGGHTGWSRAWITNHYAGLWDGQAAYESIQKMLEVSTYPNMFDRHPPFQIDGNFGICAAMSRMLVQGNEERVILLPALPDEWAGGSVKGLRLVGNAEASLVWRDGKLEEAVFAADSDYETYVIYGGSRQQLSLKAGESRTLKFK